MNKENWKHLSLEELKELSFAMDFWYSVSQDLSAPSERVDNIIRLREQIKNAYKERLDEDLEKELQAIQGLAEESQWVTEE